MHKHIDKFIATPFFNHENIFMSRAVVIRLVGPVVNR
jgi:hypothetical protein